MVLATCPVIEGIPRSLEFLNIVLFAVLAPPLIQGGTVGSLARRLEVAGDEPAPAEAPRPDLGPPGGHDRTHPAVAA